MAAATKRPEILPRREAPAPSPSNPSGSEKPRGILRRLLHATGAGAVAYGVGVANNLLLLPIYLRSWSVAVYGEWMALYAIVNYLASLDFGVTAAGVNAATMAYARGDWREFRRVQGTSWAASLVLMGLGVVLVVLPFLLYFRVERWLNLRSMSPAEARLVFCFLAVALLSNIPGRQLFSVYIAIGEFATYQWLYNAFLLGTCLATASALILGAGPVILGLVTMGGSIVTVAITAWMLYRRDPRLLPSIYTADWNMAKTLAAPTAQFGLSILASALTLQAPVVLVSRVLGGPAVALFTTTRTIANVIRQTVMLLRAPLRPELAATSATRSKAALGRLFRLAVAVDTVVGVTMFAGLWAGGPWLIRFWSRGRLTPDPGFLHLALISVLLEGFLIFLGCAGWATNRARALSIGQLVTAVASLLLAAFLVRPMGLSAIPLATLPPLLFILAPPFISDACKNAGLPRSFLVTRLLLPFAGTVVLFSALAQWFVGLGFAPEWASALLASLITCAGATIVTTGAFLTRDDRHFLSVRIPLRARSHNIEDSL